MRETGRTGFKKHVKESLVQLFPGCMLFDLDPNAIQGIPDLLVLHGEKWAALEVKAEEKASRQPNQGYYVKIMNDMGFSRFIFPENEEEVFYWLSEHFNQG